MICRSHGSQSQRLRMALSRLTAIFGADLAHPTHGLEWLQQQVLPLICKGVAAALVVPPKELTLLVTTGPSRAAKMPDGRPATKSGMHVHFHLASSPAGGKRALIVDQDSGLLIRSSVLRELYVGLGTEDPDVNWLALVDRAVFCANG